MICSFLFIPSFSTVTQSCVKGHIIRSDTNHRLNHNDMRKDKDKTQRHSRDRDVERDIETEVQIDIKTEIRDADVETESRN